MLPFVSRFSDNKIERVLSLTMIAFVGSSEAAHRVSSETFELRLRASMRKGTCGKKVNTYLQFDDDAIKISLLEITLQ